MPGTLFSIWRWKFNHSFFRTAVSSIEAVARHGMCRGRVVASDRHGKAMVINVEEFYKQNLKDIEISQRPYFITLNIVTPSLTSFVLFFYRWSSSMLLVKDCPRAPKVFVTLLFRRYTLNFQNSIKLLIHTNSNELVICVGIRKSR